MLLDTVLKVYAPVQAFCVYHTQQLIKRKDGASGIEYVVIVGIVALAIILFATPFTDAIKSTLNKVVTALGGTTVT